MNPQDVPSSRSSVDGLTYDIRYRPAYALAEIGIQQGSTLRAEAGAMVTMAGPIDLDARLEAVCSARSSAGSPAAAPSSPRIERRDPAQR